MWRREAKAGEVLRIGRHAVERWSRAGAGWRLVGQGSLLEGAVDAPEAALAAAITTALQSNLPMPKRVTVIVESAWLPLLLVDTGGLLWGDAPLALVRHRLSALGAGDEATAWDVRADGRAGERFALGYGLPPRVKSAVVDAVGGVGCTLSALTPAFLWAWQQRPVHQGWWIYAEQDRSLLARFVGGRVTAFNSAALLIRDAEDAERAVGIESSRWGIVELGPVQACAWYAGGSNGRIAWNALAADGAESHKVAA